MDRSALLPHLYLVGFMGSGKSTVGPRLASLLERPFYDLDDLIEADQGKTINEIFRSQGEEYFREIESELLHRTARRLPFVLALGGGTFLAESNRQLIQSSGISIWLKVRLEVAWERCRDRSDRPLAGDPVQFGRLFQQRQQLYRAAHLHVDTTGKSAEQISQEIRERLPQEAI